MCVLQRTWVANVVENNGSDKTDTDDSEQCLRCDEVFPYFE